MTKNAHRAKDFDMKRTISILLLILTLALSICLIGCKRVKKDEAKEIVKELVMASYDLNVIYFGEGLKHDENAEGENGYVKVDDDALYTSRKELIKETRRVFTDSYAQEIINTSFYGMAGGIEGTANYARYLLDEEGYLMIKKDSDVIDGDIAQYDYDSIEIVKIKKNLIIARIDTVNLDSNQTVQINISYSADIDGNMDWRLDSATY